MLPQYAGTGISNVFSWRKHLFMELLTNPESNRRAKYPVIAPN